MPTDPTRPLPPDDDRTRPDFPELSDLPPMPGGGEDTDWLTPEMGADLSALAAEADPVVGPDSGGRTESQIDFSAAPNLAPTGDWAGADAGELSLADLAALEAEAGGPTEPQIELPPAPAPDAAPPAEDWLADEPGDAGLPDLAALAGDHADPFAGPDSAPGGGQIDFSANPDILPTGGDWLGEGDDAREPAVTGSMAADVPPPADDDGDDALAGLGEVGAGNEGALSALFRGGAPLPADAGMMFEDAFGAPPSSTPSQPQPQPAGPAVGPAADWGEPGGESEYGDIDLANLPPVEGPAAPGSGWLDVPPEAFSAGGGASGDILSGPPSGIDPGLFASPPTGGSDVIRGLFPSKAGASHIFTDRRDQATEAVPQSELRVSPSTLSGPVSNLVRPEDVGSSVYRGAPSGGEVPLGELPPGGEPKERTTVLGPNYQPDPAGDAAGLLAELARMELPSGPRPGSPGRPSAAGAGADGTPDFNEVDTSGSGSNLFADSTSPDFHLSGAPSGIDVLGSLGMPSGQLVGPQSSIFSRDLDDAPADAPPSMGDAGASQVDVNEIPLMGSSDEATEAFQLPEGRDPGAFFAAPAADDRAGAVSFDLPRGNPLTSPDAAQIAEASGMIDWSLPAGDLGDLPPVSQFKSDDGNLLEGIARDAGIGASQVSLDDPEGLLGLGGQASPFRQRRPSEADQPSLDDLMLPADAPDLPPPSLVLPASQVPPELLAARSGPLPTFAPAARSGPLPAFPPAEATPFPGQPAAARPASSAVTTPAGDPITVQRGGWLVGSAAGLLVGVGVSAAAYFGNVLPPPGGVAHGAKPPVVVPADPGTEPNRGPNAGIAVLPPTPAAAREKLAAGDHKAAVAILDRLPADAAGVDVTSARGQARWLARVRDLAVSGEAAKPDDAELAKAEADLKAAAGAAAATDDDKAAAAEAALHLGLLKETTGDVPGAAAVYADAAAKFPDARPVFDAALARLKATAPARKDGARLTPKQANDLARAAVLVLVSLQAPEGDAPAAKPGKLAAAAADEPGFLFWKAANAAAAGDYDAAIKAVREARAKHDKKRLAVLGRGVNPLTDPAEQIFLKSADDLVEFWALKRDLYRHKSFGPVAQDEGILKALDQVTAAAAGAADAAKKLKDAQAMLTKLGLDKDAVAKDLEAAKKELTAAMKEVEDKGKELTVAETKAADASKKLKAADATLATIVAELKDKGFLTDKDDPAEKLTTVVKTVATTASASDAKKAAKALQDALDQVKAVKLELKDAEKAAADARETAKTAMTKVKEQIDAVKADAEKKLVEQMKLAVESQKELTEKLAAETKARKDEAASYKTTLTAAEKKAADDLADAKKAAAEELAAAMKKAEADLAAVTKKAKEDLAAEADRVAAKFAAETKDLRADVANADARRRRDLEVQAQKFAAELQAEQAKFDTALADARAGLRVPETARERAARERAALSYAAGLQLFDANRLGEAEPQFAAAVAEDKSDARYWYFLGLSRLANGNRDGAVEAFRRGAEQEVRSRPGADVIGASLERVQGPARSILAAYRP